LPQLLKQHAQDSAARSRFVLDFGRLHYGHAQQLVEREAPSEKLAYTQSLDNISLLGVQAQEMFETFLDIMKEVDRAMYQNYRLAPVIAILRHMAKG